MESASNKDGPNAQQIFHVKTSVYFFLGPLVAGLQDELGFLLVLVILNTSSVFSKLNSKTLGNVIPALSKPTRKLYKV